ncbi:Tgt2/MlaC family protein [Legionella impletisoli]|uniref:Signal peptidase n=1 Tax=Legionella impletisoli TaxID=343510 RepID=A0A917NBK3_9GAMM|nr:ABC transporter substrate-binding protein [Legionella impletisoli]GGI81099.1 signal peptidase [Legionella impletisoli]
MKTIKAFLILVTLVLSQIVMAESSPIPMLEGAANKITNTLKENRASLKNNPQVIHTAVRQYLLPIVDVTGMSRSVLGRQAWNKATSAEKQQFIREFTQLVIRTYATPLAEYSDEKVKFLPLRGPINGRFVRVNSVIVRSSGPNIPLSYSLVTKNGQWKIYDLSVEGVSLLQSFRSQFGQVLQNSNMAELIAQMKKTKAS